MRAVAVLLLAVLLLSSVAAETPDEAPIVGYVNDYADVLSFEESSMLGNQLSAIHSSGRAEIAIVTVHDLGGQDIEGFAHQLAEGNLGDTELDNGLLILVAVEERSYRFEVGRGLEPYLNDARVGRIGREILVPAFRDGRYGDGLSAAVAEVDGYLGGDYEIAQETWLNWFYIVLFLIFLLPALIQLLNFIFTIRRSTRDDEKYFTAAAIAASLFRGGRGGGGLGGVGGGGFGGGSFGGGGASGGW